MKNNRVWAGLSGLLLCAATLSAASAPELKYVVILSRHGVRSPTWDTARLNQYSAQPWPDWGVPPGDLTPHGRQLIQILGSYYHERFTRDRLLDPQGCGSAARVYIWADTDQRTLETGRAFAESLLPGCGLGIHSLPGDQKDPLFSGVSSPDPQAAAAALRTRLGDDPQRLLGRHRAEIDALQFILTGKNTAPKQLIEPPERVEPVVRRNAVELGGPFATASSLSEDLLLEYADGMQGARLGWGRLTRENLLRVLELHGVYADLMRRTPELARPRGSNLVAHILASMEQAVDGKPVAGALGSPDTSVLVLSGHDTNQSNVSGMLNLSWALPGYSKDETPPGGAIIFSLWLDPPAKPGDRNYFVRLEYLAASLDQMRNARKLSLATPPLSQQVSTPGCKATPQSGCSWDRFKSVLQHAIEASATDFEIH